MELYLDSVNINEIKEASKLGYLTGLTTTPTFMVREGVKDIDAQILEIAKHVDILQVEALGDNAEEIVAEAKRQINLGLSKDKTVFKIPISLEGTRACKMLVNEGFMVNLHLVYTVQQAYMAFAAGATYVCPLVGRLQDQGHDALGLVKQCVEITQKYGYKSKIMFSSVRYPEHIKNALSIGVHTITVPWKIMKGLTDNHLTTIGTNQFIEDTRILTNIVGDSIVTEDVSINASKTVGDALILMTKSQLGAIVVLDNENNIQRIFTDGDLRRLSQEKGSDIQSIILKDLEAFAPKSIDVDESLYEAKKLFLKEEINTLVATQNGKFAGLLDIQQVL